MYMIIFSQHEDYDPNVRPISLHKDLKSALNLAKKLADASSVLPELHAAFVEGIVVTPCLNQEQLTYVRRQREDPFVRFWHGYEYVDGYVGFNYGVYTKETYDKENDVLTKEQKEWEDRHFHYSIYKTPEVR